jgi:hypothetical protein
MDLEELDGAGAADDAAAAAQVQLGALPMMASKALELDLKESTDNLFGGRRACVVDERAEDGDASIVCVCVCMYTRPVDALHRWSGVYCALRARAHAPCP